VDIKIAPTGSIYFIKNNCCDLSSIKNNKIKILNNNEIAILNELNYLNPNLDISQLKFSEKKDKSAIIKAKENSNKYFGTKNIYFVIENNQQNKTIDLSELIKKAMFLKFRDEHIEKIKEIKNININNLMYSDINLEIEDLNIQKENISFSNFCNSIVFPVQNHEETYSSPACKYTKETTKTIQITIGLNKSIGIESSKETSSTSEMKQS
jgi:hypothetical protein